MLFFLIGSFFYTSAVYGKTQLCFKIEGLSDARILKNIHDRLSIDEQHNCRSSRTIFQIKKRFNRSLKEIRLALQPFGYFKPVIRDHLSYFHHHWQATYQIYLGPALRIRKLNIIVSGPGRFNDVLRQYLRQIPLHDHDILDIQVYNDIKQKLFKIIRNQGYINATFKNKIIIDLKNYHASILLELLTGDKYYYGPVKFTNHIYNQAFMNRIIYLNQQDFFSSNTLIDLQESMEKSYYFKHVIFMPDFSKIQNHHIPLTVDYTVPKKRRYHLGFGYGTLTGPRLIAGYNLRRINADGHHFDSELKLSSVLSTLTANYFIPGKNPLTDNWIIGATIKQFQPKSGSSTSATFTAGYSTKVKDIDVDLTLNYLTERFKIWNKPHQTAHIFYPNLGLQYVKADDLINPSSGISINFNLRGASQSLWATSSFIQSEVKGKLIITPISFGKIILRGDIGMTGVHKLYRFPLSLRYFAGGINSIRGFADSSIGPGKYLLVGSAEYQQHLVSNWYGAIFYDVGNATNHFDTPFARGTGIGIVYKTLVGPIKLYFAQAISKKTRPNSIEFSVGPEFS